MEEGERDDMRPGEDLGEDEKLGAERVVEDMTGIE